MSVQIFQDRKESVKCCQPLIAVDSLLCPRGSERLPRQEVAWRLMRQKRNCLLRKVGFFGMFGFSFKQWNLSLSTAKLTTAPRRAGGTPGTPQSTSTVSSRLCTRTWTSATSWVFQAWGWCSSTAKAPTYFISECTSRISSSLELRSQTASFFSWWLCV